MNTKTLLMNDEVICQADYPLDWYQPEFVPYAEEYNNLPDRSMSKVVKWMHGYIEPAMSKFGESLLFLAHYYMGGDIVSLVKQFGGVIGDSYQLALIAKRKPQAKIIIESAVHFMAESISILANDDQQVLITNPKSGCTMEMFAKEYMVKPAFQALIERYGETGILPICYMNTSGRIKALTGKYGGATCTSSNVKKIFQWGLAQNKKILFIPDKNMGENVAMWLDIPQDDIVYWPGGNDSLQFDLAMQPKSVVDAYDRAKLILFDSHCAVHDYYQEDMVRYWQNKGYHVIAHPECKRDVISVADSHGSTAFMWEHVTKDKANVGRYAIATEDHMIKNLKNHCQSLNIEVVNVGDAQLNNLNSRGCGCATMSRNDPPHFVGLVDLLMKDKVPDLNIVQPGDIVNEFTGVRKRLSSKDQELMKHDARKALQMMIDIIEAAK